jgi:hypothetical protein
MSTPLRNMYMYNLKFSLEPMYRETVLWSSYREKQQHTKGGRKIRQVGSLKMTLLRIKVYSLILHMIRNNLTN